MLRFGIARALAAVVYLQEGETLEAVYELSVISPEDDAAVLGDIKAIVN
jgi:hypothetical protein